MISNLQITFGSNFVEPEIFSFDGQPKGLTMKYTITSLQYFDQCPHRLDVGINVKPTLIERIVSAGTIFLSQQTR